jgi:hypothetical protein
VFGAVELRNRLLGGDPDEVRVRRIDEEGTEVDDQVEAVQERVQDVEGGLQAKESML